MIAEIRPQVGPQTEFLETWADIAVYGGGAGGGKSFGLLLEPLYDIDNPEFQGVIFRRNSVQVRNPGGLWDASMHLYYGRRAHPREAFLEWVFPSKAGVKFAHLENEKSVFDWQGSEIAYLAFDELTHFTAKQFWYMLSRNRSMSGAKCRVRATTNPDCDSWVRQLIDWWIGADGLPIKERSGVIRFFIRIDDTIIWADTKKELLDQYGKDQLPKSFTFIAALIHDNKILLERDPGYLANLRALSRVDRERLLGGNWNVRAIAGTLFQAQWFPIVDEIPGGWINAVRFWDRAATKPNEGNQDPDWTRGLLLYQYPNGKYCVADLKSMRDSPAKVEDLIKNVASHDTNQVRIKSQQDPGSAGVKEADDFIAMLSGYDVHVETMPRDKITRAKGVSAQSEYGNVMVKRAPWNEAFFSELEAFGIDSKGHDDIVDVLSGAFNDLNDGGFSTADVT